MNPRSVIIFQGAEGATHLLRESMSEYGLMDDVDFVTFCNCDRIDRVTDVIFENQPQMLITGMITGSTEEDLMLINQWRSINPQLVIVGYSSSLSIAKLPIDMRISKMSENHYEQVKDAILDFHSGKLRKTP
jgi:hypothetical protein